MNQLTEDELMDTKLSLNRLTFPLRAADTITDNRLTLMSDTDKITDNRNQNFYAFSCTAECQRGSDVEIKDGLFVLYLCGSCLRCAALHSRSSSLLRDISANKRILCRSGSMADKDSDSDPENSISNKWSQLWVFTNGGSVFSSFGLRYVFLTHFTPTCVCHGLNLHRITHCVPLTLTHLSFEQTRC